MTTGANHIEVGRPLALFSYGFRPGRGQHDCLDALVVGISSRHDRPGYSVPAYLQRHGYRIIPVNPNLEEVLGERAYPDLLSIPEPVDVVEVFRRSEEVLPIVQQALKIGAKVIWMQEGIVNETAANAALAAGLDVVMDMCMRAAHRRLFGSSGE